MVPAASTHVRKRKTIVVSSSSTPAGAAVPPPGRSVHGRFPNPPVTFPPLVGPSGAGKSTVLALIAGLLVPDAGAVTAGPSGHALGAWDEDAYRSLVAVSFGDGPLHRGSVEENVTLGRTDVEETDVEAALSIVDAKWHLAFEGAAIDEGGQRPAPTNPAGPGGRRTPAGPAPRRGRDQSGTPCRLGRVGPIPPSGWARPRWGRRRDGAAAPDGHSRRSGADRSGRFGMAGRSARLPSGG
jgi:energy-coupling factor transporter ATP-binding protein EcfA2